MMHTKFMRDFNDQKVLGDYYEKLNQLQKLGITHEQGTRIAFQTLLDAPANRRAGLGARSKADESQTARSCSTP
jgi:hypothetical protein